MGRVWGGEDWLPGLGSSARSNGVGSVLAILNNLSKAIEKFSIVSLYRWRVMVESPRLSLADSLSLPTASPRPIAGYSDIITLKITLSTVPHSCRTIPQCTYLKIVLQHIKQFYNATRLV